VCLSGLLMPWHASIEVLEHFVEKTMNDDIASTWPYSYSWSTIILATDFMADPGCHEEHVFCRGRVLADW
jgi:hypothetical protein